MIAINNLVLPDSMQLADSATLQINVPEDGYWISVFRNIPGGPVTMLIQDNGEGDLDNVRGRVRMQFKAAAFISAGQYDIHVAAFNFPVQRVSPNFFKGTVSYKIKIN